MNDRITKQKIFDIFDQFDFHLLNDQEPSIYFTQIKNHPLFAISPFHMLKQLINTAQSLQHHPEGNVWNHTMLVIDKAAQHKHKTKDPSAFMWAALLHDIGKPAATNFRKGKITAYNHDKKGALLAREFLSFSQMPAATIQHICTLIYYHMQILFIAKDLPFADKKNMELETDVKEIALLGLCDRTGRIGVNEEKEKKYVVEFLKKCHIDDTSFLNL